MILEMSRVQIWGLKQALKQVIPILHQFGGLQIDDVHNIPDVMVQPLTIPDDLQKEHEDIDILIASINGLVDLFSKFKQPQDENDHSGQNDLYSIKTKVEDLTSQIQYLNNRKKELQDELVSLSKYSEMLRIIAPVMPPSSKRSGNASMRALVHESQMREVNLLSQQLKLLTQGKFEMITVKVSDATVAVIGIFPYELMSQVETFMKNEKVAQLMLPEEYAYLSTDDALDHIQKKIEIDHKELDEIDKRFQRMAGTWLSKLKTWQLVCEDLHDEHDAYAKIGETEFTFTIFGWVPSENLASLEEVLRKSFGDQVVLSVIEVPKELRERIPVAMRNPVSLEPFENLVKMRAIPSYTDIDPSPLVAVFMPIFFGMMIGDVGYGLIMFLLAVLLLRKPRAGLLGDVLKTLRFGSLWSIFFGILFGEYFGSLGESWGLHPLWFSRSEGSSITSLIIMSIAVGTLHIMLGLAIGAWNGFKHNNRHEAFERIGMILGLFGIIIAAGSIAAQLPYALVGWITLGIGIVILAASLGKIGFFLGPIEFIGVIGSILSYLRIAALGLASVFLAEVANDMAGMVGSIVVGVFIAGLIHALNIIIGVLSPTIQSLRLQYVEFFRRFFEGGQMAFSPFSRRINAQERPKATKS